MVLGSSFIKYHCPYIREQLYHQWFCIENWGVEEDEKPAETVLPMNELFEDVSNRNFTIKDKSSEVYTQGIGDPYWRK